MNRNRLGNVIIALAMVAVMVGCYYWQPLALGIAAISAVSALANLVAIFTESKSYKVGGTDCGDDE